VTQRLFAAIDAGPDLAAALGRAVSRVRAQAPRASWAGDASAHLTLVFLGEVPDEVVAPVRGVVREAARRHSSLTLRVHGAAVFGRPTHPRTLWARVDGDRQPLAALAAMAADLRRALVPLGFPPEDRAFHPHLTLARARGPRGDPDLARCAAALRDHDFGLLRAEAVRLYRSELLPSGARHHVLERCALGTRS
jgi:2'-5' RNA ligase